MPRWVDVPLHGELNKNVDGIALTSNAAAIENAFVNEMKALSRFPQLTTFATLTPQKPVYLREWRGDMYAVCGGRVYSVDMDGTVADLTGAAVEGGKRVIFTETEDELVMAAGRQPIKLRGELTEILSEQAPESTHVQWASSYLLALEKDSGRFRYSDASSFYTTWNDLSVLSAEGKPDNLVALLVTDFGELLLAGKESIEQHNPSPSGDQPFYRQWMLGNGVYAPYTFISANNMVWGVDSKKEFLAYSTQVGNTSSSNIQSKLEQIDDWTDAWAMELPVAGHRFIVLQMPFATNDYGTKGVTYLYNYKMRKWAELFGWNEELKLPQRWDGWSYTEIGNRKFVGGNGRIYELGGYSGDNTQKMVWRSGHIKAGSGNQFSIEKMRLFCKRGDELLGDSPAAISVKVNKNNRGFGRWLRRNLGEVGKSNAPLDFGNMGVATSFQIEIEVTDPAQVEIAGLQLYIDMMDE